MVNNGDINGYNINHILLLTVINSILTTMVGQPPTRQASLKSVSWLPGCYGTASSPQGAGDAWRPWRYLRAIPLFWTSYWMNGRCFFLRIDIALNEHVVCFWKCSDQNMYDWITYQNTIYVYNYHRDTCMAMEYNIISLCDKHSTMFAPPKDVYILVWQVYFKRNMWQWWTRGSWGTLYTETIENFCGLGYCTQKPQVLSMRV